MAKTPLWRSIADSLTREIAQGHYAPGDRLPTETRLAERFGVNRHTLRRAITDMAEAGLVLPRRGAGIFVAQVATEYRIGRRVRFHQNLTAAGHVPSKQILHLATRSASKEEGEALDLAPNAQVHAYESLSFSDGQVIAISHSIFPAERFAGLTKDLEDTKSVTAALNRHGVTDYTRASTRLTATLATATQALHLKCRENDPVLMTVGINIDQDGVPVEFGQTWFAGDRVTLTLDDT